MFPTSLGRKLKRKKLFELFIGINHLGREEEGVGGGAELYYHIGEGVEMSWYIFGSLIVKKIFNRKSDDR